MAEGLIPNERDGCGFNIMHSLDLRWWLWICNLGNFTGKVIGAGVQSAQVAMNDIDEAVFTFSRADDTECTVRLRCIRRGKGRELRVYM